MTRPESQPFEGLFNLMTPGIGRDFNWTFYESDLNDSGRRLFAHIDHLFAAMEEPGWVFLTTIENEAEAGRFPEMTRFAWAASRDVDEVGVSISPGYEDVLERLRHLHTP